mmetsp:Transcript_6524/g.13122  ORF Transcript_6524/g.13122 Transcript_6524/m.13122 type:complete len:102 (-) Transcript_6524:18-323(-)
MLSFPHNPDHVKNPTVITLNTKYKLQQLFLITVIGNDTEQKRTFMLLSLSLSLPLSLSSFSLPLSLSLSLSLCHCLSLSPFPFPAFPHGLDETVQCNLLPF